jgi:eukaryotic-like serine/threonine-protein kinase
MFPQIFGKYVLERELAAGGMAKVFLAMLRGAGGFEKRLVVKQIRPELASDPAFVQRFVEEAKTAVELSHPNIVPVYELGVEQGVYYIAMEFCTGITLAELLAESGKLSPEEGAYIGVEICRALDYAHRRSGIVHRDATPRNVLIDEEGAVRLIDFGIAAPAYGNLKKSEVFGSPGHMPPEQLAGKPLTPATDVFAVAALLVEAWAGRPPFRRSTARESEEALYEPLPPLSEHHPELEPLEALVSLALAHDPKKRPARAELFARPLRDFMRSVDSGDVARRLGGRVRRSSRSSVPPDEKSRGSLSDSAGGSTPKSSSPLTQTFAARNEVKEWTRPFDSEPPESGPNRDVAYSTRKIPSLPPSPGVSGDPEALEKPQARSSPPRPGWPLKLALGVVLPLAAATGLWLLRSPVRASNQRAVADHPPAAQAHPPATQSLSAIGGAPGAIVLAASAAPVPTPPLVTAAPQSSGVLRLTADPPASVSVQGSGKSRSLHTPVRDLRVPAGSYTVTFRNDTYGAPVVARVVVQSGLSRSVHADFREAEPRVTVR